MQDATVNDYRSAWDTLKASGLCRATNCFANAKELAALMERKPCELHTTPASLFLFIPYHDKYYDCLYLSRDSDALVKDLRDVLEEWQHRLPIRLSIIGKEPTAGALSAEVSQLGFPMLKKLIRFRLVKAPKKVLSAMRILGSEFLPLAGFARPEEAEEIQEVIRSEFEIVSDNVPELEEIRGNIEKNQVTVVRMDGKVVALHYFKIDNNICHGYFDVVRKEYRDRQGLFFGISLFEREYFKDAYLDRLRYYGWRDASRDRLLKSSRECSAQEDGLIIYNHLWHPEPECNG